MAMVSVKVIKILFPFILLVSLLSSLHTFETSWVFFWVSEWIRKQMKANNPDTKEFFLTRETQSVLWGKYIKEDFIAVHFSFLCSFQSIMELYLFIFSMSNIPSFFHSLFYYLWSLSWLGGPKKKNTEIEK